MKKYNQYVRQANLFRVFAYEQRLMILDLLREKGELNVAQICDGLYDSQATVSKNLAILRKARLVISKRQGREQFYSLNLEGIREALNVLNLKWSEEK